MHAPLYSLSAGELGSYATSVEEKLSQIFEMVTRWNAVLLLDEADVFLEQRTDGIAHNMLVAGILHRIFPKLAKY
jgi:SpoVK/Ycf46/Vps4 family AAA+-type ATPase